MLSIRAIGERFASQNISVNSLKIAKNYVLGLQKEIKLIKTCLKGKRMVKTEGD